MEGFLILANSRTKPGEMIALVDRTKCKTQWWTETVDKAIVFRLKSAAEVQCRKLKFNKPSVWTYEEGKKRLGQVLVHSQRQSFFGRMLAQHEMLWHDDDWNEGTNS